MHLIWRPTILASCLTVYMCELTIWVVNKTSIQTVQTNESLLIDENLIARQRMSEDGQTVQTQVLSLVGINRAAAKQKRRNRKIKKKM